MAAQLLTVDDVAGRLQLSTATVRRLQHKIGFCKIGGSVRFREADLERFLESKTVGPRYQPVRLRSLRSLAGPTRP